MNDWMGKRDSNLSLTQPMANWVVATQFFFGSPLLGEDFQFDDHIIFSNGLKPPTSWLLHI